MRKALLIRAWNLLRAKCWSLLVSVMFVLTSSPSKRVEAQLKEIEGKQEKKKQEVSRILR